MTTLECASELEPAQAFVFDHISHALWETMMGIPSNRKVDAEGNYQPFQNITVVCHLNAPQHATKLRSLPETLQDIAGRYISPMPFDSYHATVITGPLSIQYGARSWTSVLYNECWERMATFLSKELFVPDDLEFSKDHVVSSKSVTIYFPPPKNQEVKSNPSQKRKLSVYEGNALSMQLRQSLHAIGRKIHRNPHIPRDDSSRLYFQTDPEQSDASKEEEDDEFFYGEELMSDRFSKWHITLAYPREAGGAMPLDVAQAVRQAVHEAFAEAFGTSHVQFHPARLCLSPDMTEFTPWNGKSPETIG